jgi:hypothetical protein
MERDLEALQAQEQDAIQAHQAASAEALRVADEVRRARERLTLEALEEQAERFDLEALVPHLVAEVAAAHEAAGEATLHRLEAEHTDLDAARTAAQAALDAATAALEAHAAHVRGALASHPAVLARTEGGPLLPQRAARVERALESHLHTLAILAEGPVETEMAGGVPLMYVLNFPGGPGLGFALEGRAPAVWADAIRRAETWLGTFRQAFGRR